MASDGCQPMERFSKKNGFTASGSDGSAQKSWASCPSSMRQQQNYPGTHQYSSGGGGEEEGTVAVLVDIPSPGT